MNRTRLIELTDDEILTLLVLPTYFPENFTPENGTPPTSNEVQAEILRRMAGRANIVINPMFRLEVNQFDYEGVVCDTQMMTFTDAQIADIVNHAAQYAIMARTDETTVDAQGVLAELDEALAAAGVITEEP